jgi:hypothetical protein
MRQHDRQKSPNGILLVCFEAAMPERRRLLLVGWDAADWNLIHQRMGGMPPTTHL